jgi:hypothetical protein
MKIFEDGNFRESVRIALVIAGLTLIIGSVKVGLATATPKITFLIGIIIAAIGGYASQAHMLKIKPFDNGYKKARESHRTEDDNRNGHGDE